MYHQLSHEELLSLFHRSASFGPKTENIVPVKTLTNAVAVSEAAVSVVNSGVRAAETAAPVGLHHFPLLSLSSACCDIVHENEHNNVTHSSI